jgi:putative oxidoreductase
MKGLVLVGRILVGAYYLYNALNHLVFAPGQLTEYAASKGVPLPLLAVIVTGLLLLIGGLSILLGVLPRVGVLALVVFFLPVTFWMHDFWNAADPQMRVFQMTQFAQKPGAHGQRADVPGDPRAVGALAQAGQEGSQ